MSAPKPLDPDSVTQTIHDLDKLESWLNGWEAATGKSVWLKQSLYYARGMLASVIETQGTTTDASGDAQ